MIITARSIHELAARALTAVTDRGPSSLVAVELEEGVGAYRRLLKEVLDGRPAEDVDLHDLALSLMRLVLRAAVLGADDSRIEAETDDVDAPDPFRNLETLRCDAPQGRRRVGRATDPVRPWHEVVEEFRARTAVTREAWDEMTRHERTEAFTVAKQSSEALVARIQDVVARSVADGEGVARARLRVQEVAEGLSRQHAETVYRNAVQSAYARGRMTHMTQPHVLAVRPWWQVRAVRDVRTRKTHAHVNGWVMRADDPGWQATAAPFGHNCRCRLVSRSDKWVQDHGPTIHTGPLPNLPDPRWTNKPPPMVSLRIANPDPPDPEREPPAQPDRPSKGASLLRGADKHLDLPVRRALEKLDSVDKNRRGRIRPSDLGIRRPTKRERAAAKAPFAERGIDPEDYVRLTHSDPEAVDVGKVVLDRATVIGNEVAARLRTGIRRRAVAVRVGDRYHVIAGAEDALADVVDDIAGGAGKIRLRVIEAPPPLTRAHESVEAARAGLLGALDDNRLEAVREATQRALRTLGMVSRDNWRGMVGRAVIQVWPQRLDAYGALAAHNRKTGHVIHQARTLAWARAGLAKAARGAVVEADEARSLSAVLHEEIHGCGPGFDGAYQGAGAKLEEAVTELLARHSTEELLRTPLTGPGPYDRYIGSLLQVTRAHGIDDMAVVKAAKRFKAEAVDVDVVTPKAYLQRFARQLSTDSKLADHLETAVRDE